MDKFKTTKQKATIFLFGYLTACVNFITYDYLPDNEILKCFVGAMVYIVISVLTFKFIKINE